MKAILTICLCLFFTPSPAAAQASSGPIDAAGNAGGASQNEKARPERLTQQLTWRPWSDAIFVDAKRERRFVLLDLEAVWCHWCHVMDEKTYSDPAVIKLLQSHYIPVKADQDSRPDLSNRYEDYGWPATVVFDSEGHEIAKRQGYLDPREMASMLQAIIDDPTPGPSIEPEAKLELPSSPLLTDSLRADLKKKYLAGYDTAQGSWGATQKYLDWDSVEYSMALARLTSDPQAEHMARNTLTEQLHLLDPAWGGVYQYSTGGGWNSPHFEKIMQMQAENLRIYSLAYAQWRDPDYLHAAQEIRRYLATFLTSPDGAFYTSQDADLIEGKHSADYFALDDAARRKLGVPRVDKHTYARENGWAIAALVAFYDATGDPAVLKDATRSARWILANRALPGGGFRQGTKDVAGPFLGDTAAMARAFLALYAATGDRAWLAHAEAAMKFIARNFRDSQGAGFLTSKTPTDKSYTPHPQRDENVSVARTANLLSHYTGDAQYEDLARQAMRYLAAPPVVYRLPASSALLADLELGSSPLHLTIVGRKDDPVSQNLFQAALRYPSNYKRVEWWDAREGRLPNPDVQYPQLIRAAAFVCTGRACSPPIFKPEDLAEKVEKLSAAKAGLEPS
ncbi:MAG: thioredoxin domain-containing protein [Candidatus Acidiferrales bacterium]